MFTGLIQCTGRLDQIQFQGDAGRLILSARFETPLQIGESIAVNGACLTLVAQANERLTFDILRETFDKTALRDKTSGTPLNLERALRLGDPLGGHLVSGHVDGTGKLVRVENAGFGAAPNVVAADRLGPGLAFTGFSVTPTTQTATNAT